MTRAEIPASPDAGPAGADAEIPGLGRAPALALCASIFVIAACGLSYELLAGTLSSYLLGSSVTHFSVVIGMFLTAMGVGSFLSRYVAGDLLRAFLLTEIAVGIIGGLSSLALFAAFALLDSTLPVLVAVCVVVGILVGLEIPLLIRILRARLSLKEALGNVLSIDYLGALGASLLFPLVLVPNLGLVRTGIFFGLFNLLVAVVGIAMFRDQLRRVGRLTVAAGIGVAVLITAFAFAGKTTTLLEDLLYADDVIYAETTPYQRLVLTRWHNDLRLFINGNLQFSSVDEFRYHEALVHPAMGLVQAPKRILILGGGDGMAAREVLEHPGVTHIDLVDLDPAVTTLFRKKDALAALNHGSLRDPRVTVINRDARTFLESSRQRYDVVIVDLPDPNGLSVGKLYTRSFYRLIAQHLSPTGVMVTQATSPFYTTAAFWCIYNTVAAADIGGGAHLLALPYRASVPSFGNWGFVLASLRPLSPRMIRLEVATRYLSADLLPTLFVFPKDIAWRKTPINRLDNQILVKLYRGGYRQYNE